MNIRTVFILGAVIFCGTLAEAGERSYRGIRPTDANGRDGLCNPERGWRFEIGVGITPEDPVQFKYLRDLWPFPRYRKDGATVSQAYCYLTQFADGPISQQKLDALQASFDRARKDGVKFLLRFAYEFDGIETGPSCEQVLKHIEQLTPIVRKNIDVIYCLQMGWIGIWGEFHSSIHGLEKDPATVGKIVKATLEMLPEGRFTMMRRIDYEHVALKELGDDREITAETAFTQAPHARIGFFNDGTLANWHDGATFPKHEPFAEPGHPEFDQVVREGQWMPVDGELFWTDDQGITHPLFANAIRAIERFHDHHYTTFSVVHGNSELDRSTRPWTIDLWKKTPVTAEFLDACGFDYDPDYFAGVPYRTGYEFIRDHLGYRLALKSASLPAGSGKARFVLHNYGFAPPINPRELVVVAVASDGAAREIPTGADLRKARPGQDLTVDVELSLRPEERIGLWLPDSSPTLRLRPEYAVRLATKMPVQTVGGRLVHCLEIQGGGL